MEKDEVEICFIKVDKDICDKISNAMLNGGDVTFHLGNAHKEKCRKNKKVKYIGCPIIRIFDPMEKVMFRYIPLIPKSNSKN